MELAFVQNGRLGNAVFRYLACCLLCIKHGYQYKNLSFIKNLSTDYEPISEKIIKSLLSNVELALPKKIVLKGYYQHDYENFKIDILKFIEENKTIHTVSTDDNRTFYLKELIDTPRTFCNKYDFVIHIRTGDFSQTIFPYRVIIKHEHYFKLLNTINLTNKKIAVVGDVPKTQTEIEYVNKLVDYIKNKNADTTYESNDILTDFHIIKNAKEVVCCMSTFAWAAVVLSNNIKTCYLPNYPIIEKNSWLSIKRPCINTIYFDFD